MKLFDKLLGKTNHDGAVSALDDNAKGKEIIAKVNELTSLVNNLADHVAETHNTTHVQNLGGVEKIDLENSNDPAHKAILGEDFKKLQSGEIGQVSPDGKKVDANIPTQQNVPSPLPGGPVPTPSEVANAQLQAAEDTDTSKSVTQKQAEILSDAQGDAPNAK